VGASTLALWLQVLQVLDATVEIPQMGVVRSLNVHVSGALALYEYSRQRQEWGNADTPA
jgi:tRNA G18 (ribose-2'-O)-methylase SpoU